MLISCSFCGERSPDDAGYCVDCGAPLHMLAPLARRPAARATGPTPWLHGSLAGLSRARAGLAERVRPVAGLAFTIVFSCGLASYLAVGWARPLGFWLVTVLVAGALLAQQAWLHGQLWRGMCGMVLWGGLIWLLAAHLEMPWAGVLVAGWAMFRPIEYFRRAGLRAERAR